MPAGVHNALGAKLVERAGFDGVWASGLEISTAHVVSDASILTMPEYLMLWYNGERPHSSLVPWSGSGSRYSMGLGYRTPVEFKNGIRIPLLGYGCSSTYKRKDRAKQGNKGVIVQ